MDDNLKGALQKVAEALHRAIARSSDVEEALAAVKDEGYQAYLVLEVTVALSRIAGDELPPARPAGLLATTSPAPLRAAGQPEPDWVLRISAGGRDAASGEGGASLEQLTLRIAPDDREFLRSIRIRIDD